MLNRPLLLALALSSVSARSCGPNTTTTSSPPPSAKPLVTAAEAPEAPEIPDLTGAIDLNDAPRADGRPIIEIKHVSTYWSKPPLKDLRFDVVLRNDRDEPRWFVLPGTLQKPDWLGDVASLQRTELHGEEGVVLIGRTGYGLGFNVLRLPAHGVVTIRGYRAELWWKTVPPMVAFDVVTATDVHLGAERIEAWFEVDATAPRTATVEDDRWQMGHHELPSHDGPGKRAVPVAITADRRLRFRVPLDPKLGT